MSLLTNIERYYKLDGNGTESVSAQNGVDTNSNLVWVSGKINQGVDFTGGNTSRELVAPGLDLVTDLTISFWVYVKGSSFYGPVVCNMVGGGGATTNYNVMQVGQNIQLFGKNDSTYGSGTGTLSLNTWYHVVITRTTGGTATYYVNGSSVNSGSGQVPFSTPTASLRIGHRQDHYNVFDGIIDELGIWSRVLSGTEITDLYNAGAGFTYPFTPPGPAPTLSTVTPNTGLNFGGTAVTLAGSDFVSGATVLFGSNPATSVTFVNSGSITAVTPAGTGVVNVKVTNPDTQFSTLSSAFTYTGATISLISPSTGSTSGGELITVTGTGLVPGMDVLIGGLSLASTTFVNSTTVTFLAPPHAGTGTFDLILALFDPGLVPTYGATVTNGFSYVSGYEFLSGVLYDLQRPDDARLNFIGYIGQEAVVIPTPIAPIVFAVTPTVSSAIGKMTPVALSTTDEDDSFKRIIIVVEFPISKIKEVVFDGNGWGPMYTNAYNTQTAITNGWHFTILRDGGWIVGDGPVLTPFVLDTTGAENV